MSNLTVATADNFDELVLNAKGAVLVDFWAPWCGPCKMLAPTLEAIAEQYEGCVDVVKIDIEEFPEIATRYLVRSIPTLLLFDQGHLQATKVGLQSREQLNAMLEKYA